MATRETDLSHLPGENEEVPAAARRRARFTRDVIEAATSRDTDARWTTAVRCIARGGRRACAGRIAVLFDEYREEV